MGGGPDMLAAKPLGSVMRIEWRAVLDAILCIEWIGRQWRCSQRAFPRSPPCSCCSLASDGRGGGPDTRLGHPDREAHWVAVKLYAAT